MFIHKKRELFIGKEPIGEHDGATPQAGATPNGQRFRHWQTFAFCMSVMQFQSRCALVIRCSIWGLHFPKHCIRERNGFAAAAMVCCRQSYFFGGGLQIRTKLNWKVVTVSEISTLFEKCADFSGCKKHLLFIFLEKQKNIPSYFFIVFQLVC